jgi:hypothetical protein
MARERIGLSRRELERELNWLLRSPPDDPQKMAKLLTNAILTLLEKNNMRIAEDLQRDSAPDVKEEF